MAFNNSVEPIFKPKTRSKTEIFMKSMIKICFLPVSLDKGANIISFKPWTTIVFQHVFLFIIPAIFLPNIMLYLAFTQSMTQEQMTNMIESQTFVEVASFFCLFLAVLSVFFMILVCKNIELLEVTFISR